MGQMIWRCIVVAVCVLTVQAGASAAPSDVTAVVNDNGTLEIKRAFGTSGNEGSFGVQIRLEGDLNQDIRLFVDDVLLEDFRFDRDNSVLDASITVK